MKRVGDVVVDTCDPCGGVYIDHGTIEQILRERPDRVDALLAALPRTETGVDTRSIATCPTCGLAMEKRMASGGSGVIMDVCKPHGVFFDPGELHRVVAFVQREARERAERAPRGAPFPKDAGGLRGLVEDTVAFVRILLGGD